MVAGVGAVAEDGEASGGDAVVPHQLLGEGLGGLDAGGRLGGAEGGDPLDGQAVDEATGQGVLRAHDHQLAAVVPGGPSQPLDVRRLEGEVGAQGGGARVAGGDEQVGQPGRLAELPGQGVLAGAGTDEEDVHATASYRAAGVWATGWPSAGDLDGDDHQEDGGGQASRHAVAASTPTRWSPAAWT